MATQFTKDGTFNLRAISLTDKGKADAAGNRVYKVSEPSQGGIKYPDNTKVTALEPAKGLGGWFVRFPNGEIGYCDTNKIIGNESQYVAKVGQTQATASTNGNGKHAAPTNPVEKVRLLIAEKKAIEARLPQVDVEIEAAYRELQAFRAEQDKAAAEVEELMTGGAPQGTEELLGGEQANA